MEGDGDADAVRIMTAHGAKGLEAKVVMIIDDKKPINSKNMPDVIWDSVTDEAGGAGDGSGAGGVGDGRDRGNTKIPLWNRSTEFRTALGLEHLETQWRAAQAEERRRLLYVALTRARQEIYFCPFGKTPKDAAKTEAETWSGLVTANTQAAQSEPAATAEQSEQSEFTRKFTSGRKVTAQVWETQGAGEEAAAATIEVEVEAGAAEAATAGDAGTAGVREVGTVGAGVVPQAEPEPLVINPSTVGLRTGFKARLAATGAGEAGGAGSAGGAGGAGGGNQSARAYGQLVHRLIERMLPLEAARHEAVATEVVRRWRLQRAGELDEDGLKRAAAEAAAALRIPEVAAMTRGRMMTEVPFAARVVRGGGEGGSGGEGGEVRSIEGRVDALALFDAGEAGAGAGSAGGASGAGGGAGAGGAGGASGAGGGAGATAGGRLVFAEFKTSTAPDGEELPPRVAAQVEAYRAALRQTFPTREVSGLVVWTRSGRATPC